MDPVRGLIVNADDLGWSRSVNAGIIEAHLTGIVTSTSILATGAAFSDAAALALTTPSLDAGVHLSFYRGATFLPPERVSTLVGPDGQFLGSWRRIVGRLLAGTFDLGQLEAELRAQIAAVKAAGIAPTHVDGEKHLHLWPSIFDLVCRLAVESGIPQVRVVREPPGLHAIPLGLGVLSRRDAGVARRCGLVTPNATIGVTEPPRDLEAFARILRGAHAPHVEFVVHPGHVDEEFMRIQRTVANRLVRSREDELAVLTSPEAREMVERSGYSLVRRTDDVGQ
ncbi:MAG TPA: ChbG/HpnK family deacetylase [Coriobacteriia bacterium]